MNEQAQKKHLQRVHAETLSSILEVSDKEDIFQCLNEFVCSS